MPPTLAVVPLSGMVPPQEVITLEISLTKKGRKLGEGDMQTKIGITIADKSSGETNSLNLACCLQRKDPGTSEVGCSECG